MKDFLRLLVPTRPPHRAFGAAPSAAVSTILSLVPRLVLYLFVVLSVVGAIAAMLLGWVPSRESGRIILPFYFAVLLTVLSLACIVSGNTLVRHYRTGTVQRGTSPAWFWGIVAGQLFVATILFLFAYLRWQAWRS